MATDIFETASSVFFVGGSGDKSGGANNGGATKAWFDANYTKDEGFGGGIMGSNGSPLQVATAVATVGTDTAQKFSAFNITEAGMVAYLSGTNVVVEGRYEILTTDGLSEITFPADTFDGGNAGDLVVRVGGSFENLPQALTEADPSNFNVTIYTNKTETLAAPLAVPSGNVADNKWLRIIGYNTIARDQDRGGGFYGGALDAFKEANSWTMTNPSATWTEIDCDDVGAVGIVIDGDDNIELANLFIHNITDADPNALVGLANSPVNTKFTNCKLNDTHRAINGSSFNLLVDDCYFGDTVGHYGIYTPLSTGGASILSCVFDDGVNGVSSRLATIKNNLFYKMTTFAVQLAYGTNVSNCTFYDVSDKCIVVSDATEGGIIEWNNIFVVTDGDADFAVYGTTTGGSVIYSDYSCAWAVANPDGSNAPWFLDKTDEDFIGANSIIADPLFTDASTGDFRLLPGSPCINTGKRNLINDRTTMGALLQAYGRDPN